MRLIDDAGLIEVELDEEGNPVRVVRLSGSMSGSFSMTARPTVVRKEDTATDEGHNRE